MKTSVKIDKSLAQRAEQAAKQAGYSSREEFIEHAIEKALAPYEHSDAPNVLEKLKGLGYLK